MLKGKVTTLFADLDGTLVDSNEKLLGLYATFDMVKGLSKRVGDDGNVIKSFRALRELRRAVEKGSASDRTNLERGADVISRRFNLSQDEATRILEETVQECFPKWKSWFKPIPGAAEFLTWAKPNYSMILATNPVWSESIVRLRAGWGGIDTSVFKWITHSGRMHSCKPNPEYYAEILKQEGLKPENVLHFGNDFEKDVAAVYAGIPVFVLSKRKFSEITPIGSKAPAWTGSYDDLKRLLQS